MVIEKEVISFEQVKKGYVLKNDMSGVGAYTLVPSIIKTFLSNPSLDDYSKCRNRTNFYLFPILT